MGWQKADSAHGSASAGLSVLTILLVHLLYKGGGAEVLSQQQWPSHPPPPFPHLPPFQQETPLPLSCTKPQMNSKQGRAAPESGTKGPRDHGCPVPLRPAVPWTVVHVSVGLLAWRKNSGPGEPDPSSTQSPSGTGVWPLPLPPAVWPFPKMLEPGVCPFLVWCHLLVCPLPSHPQGVSPFGVRFCPAAAMTRLWLGPLTKKTTVISKKPCNSPRGNVCLP